MKRINYFLALFLCIVLIAPGSLSADIFDNSENEIEDKKTLVINDLKTNPIEKTSDFFTENLGQWKTEFEFIGHTSFGQVAFGKDCVYFNFREIQVQKMDLFDEFSENIEVNSYVLKYLFQDACEVEPKGLKPLPHTSNYFLGNDPSRWVTDVLNYQEVLYENLWPGIDLRYYFSSSGLKYEFIVHPGGNPDNIKVQVEGHENFLLQKDQLIINLPNGQSLFDNDLIGFYEENIDDRIDVYFMIIDDNTYTFDLGEYDFSKTVVIDPVVYSTYVGGSTWDYTQDMDYDLLGNTYVTGFTKSSDFPNTTGVYDETFNGMEDIFVFKLNPTGKTLVYSTFIGGNESERGNSIAVDSFGNVFVTGSTYSSDFPVTGNAYDQIYNGSADVYILKLNQTGKKLVYSTLIGDSGLDYSYGLAIDSLGHAYITGNTSSSNFPTTNGSYDRTFGGVFDVFVTKVNASGDDLIYSTFIGGSNEDVGFEIDIDVMGNVYITGYTIKSGPLSYPTTPGAYDTIGNSNQEVIVSKINSTGDKLMYSTVVAGGNNEAGISIEVDHKGYIYVVGYTTSTGFPTTPDVYQSTYKGTSSSNEGFILKLNISFDDLIFSSFLGDTGSEYILDIKVNTSGIMYVVGLTDSQNFPVTQFAENKTIGGGGYDAFVTIIISSCKDLIYSSFIGGSGFDAGYGIAIRGDMEVYVAGITGSNNFPTTVNAFSRKLKGNYDGFVYKLRIIDPISPPQGLVGILGYGYVNLGWSHPVNWIEANLTGYNIYRGETKGSMTLLTSIGKVTAYNDTTVKVGQTYYYYMTALNASSESITSNMYEAADSQEPFFGMDSTPASAFTGGDISFNVKVRDNILVSNVSVEYWYGTEARSNVSMTTSGNHLWTYSIEIEHTLERLNYIFHANDTFDNWAESNPRNLTIIDNILSVFEIDYTPDFSTTGEKLMFAVDVSDNIEVAGVWVEYWFGSIVDSKTNSSMTAGFDDSWIMQIKIPLKSIDTLHYTFHASDTSGNWNYTSESNVMIIDNDIPIFIKDKTFGNPTTGDSYEFSVEVTDNIEVSNVRVEYWFGTESHNNESMIKDTDDEDEWHLAISVPHTSKNLYYFYYMNDSFSNWNFTSQKEVKVLDNDKPTFKNESSPIRATTGESIMIEIEVSDNIGVFNLTLEYWFGSGNHNTVPLTVDGIKYSYKVKMPSKSLVGLNYFFESYDTSDNSNKTQVNIVVVSDNDPPEFLDVIKDENTETGSDFEITVTVIDNIKINNVSMEYWFGSDKPQKVRFQKSGDEYVEWIEIPKNSLKTLHFKISSMDTSGNLNTTETFDVSIVDNIKPTIKKIKKVTITQGDSVNIVVDADDNIGISVITWSDTPIQPDDLSLIGVVDKIGTYEITVTVSDEAGNNASMKFNLTVEEKPKDKDDKSTGEDLTMIMIIVIIVIIIVIIGFLLFLKKRKKKGKPKEAGKLEESQEAPPPQPMAQAPPLTTPPEPSTIEPPPGQGMDEQQVEEPKQPTIEQEFTEPEVPLDEVPEESIIPEPELTEQEQPDQIDIPEPEKDIAISEESPPMWDPLGQAGVSEAPVIPETVEPESEEPPKPQLTEEEIMKHYPEPETLTPAQGFKFCMRCGAEIQEGLAICPRCGSDLMM